MNFLVQVPLLRGYSLAGRKSIDIYPTSPAHGRMNQWLGASSQTRDVGHPALTRRAGRSLLPALVPG